MQRPTLKLSKVKDHNIFDRYTIIRTIGQEKTSLIHLVYDSLEKNEVILKINTLTSAFPFFCNEIEILKRIDHPNIIKMLDHHIDKSRKKAYIILEYISNGDMFDFIDERSVLTENQCVKFIKIILKTILYCHQNGICHRDIKPENILITSTSDLKIIDFGYSKLDPTKQFVMSRHCGSPGFVAPEILSNNISIYNEKCDVWSIGITLYTMLFGCEPFYDESFEGMKHNILFNDFSIPNTRIVDDELIDLLRKMLIKDPYHRISVENALSYSFF